MNKHVPPVYEYFTFNKHKFKQLLSNIYRTKFNYFHDGITFLKLTEF